MPVKPDKPGPGPRDRGDQPPPPDLPTGGGDTPWQPRGHGEKPMSEDTAEAIHAQLTAIRGVVGKLLEEAKEAKLRRRLELVPVRVADLMRGCQAAVARANRSTQAGEEDGEDIERMAIKDLEVELTAPIIESAHAEDPVVMLPNLKSVDAESPSLRLKFSVVGVPRQQRG